MVYCHYHLFSSTGVFYTTIEWCRWYIANDHLFSSTGVFFTPLNGEVVQTKDCTSTYHLSSSAAGFYPQVTYAAPSVAASPTHHPRTCNLLKYPNDLGNGIGKMETETETERKPRLGNEARDLSQPAFNGVSLHFSRAEKMVNTYVTAVPSTPFNGDDKHFS
jgi:hypothetical protein